MSVENLKERVYKAQESGDIASLYILEQEAQEIFDEETLQGFYANILDLALERLTETLEAHRVMDMQEVQDFATLRALYEYAIEHYHANAISDASALFEVLGGLSNDKAFSHAMKVHQKACDSKIELDDFLEVFADIDATQSNSTFYISAFRDAAQQLLNTPQKSAE